MQVSEQGDQCPIHLDWMVVLPCTLNKPETRTFNKVFYVITDKKHNAELPRHRECPGLYCSIGLSYCQLKHLVI